MLLCEWFFIGVYRNMQCLRAPGTQGPKCYYVNGSWYLNPQHLGTWAFRDTVVFYLRDIGGL